MGDKLNKAAFDHAKKLIRDGKFKADTDWSEQQPKADDENTFLDKNGWDEYAKWYLGLERGANDETKKRYEFPYGDFKQVHRSGVIAAKQRAAQNDHQDVEKAADELLEMIDKAMDDE